MEVHTNQPLKDYTTMRLGGPARFLADAHDAQQAAALYRNAIAKNLKVFILGGGSNVVADDVGFDGLIIRVQIPGFAIISDDENTTTIKIGAGESWDEIVAKTVDMNLTGIEAMSAIPGTVGGVPITNVGAYGQEIADTLQSLEAYDTQTDQFITLSNSDCQFAYRDSVFRNQAKNRYIITSITVTLSKKPPTPPFYDAVQKYFDEHHITDYTPQTIRAAVTDIRVDKLPDPARLPNSGSFFKNAIISQQQLDELQAGNPDIPVYPMQDSTYKIPSGWLIEHAGLKGQLLHGIRVHDKNCLVLINESASSFGDLEQARADITQKINDTFHIQLEQEPLQIG